MEKKNFTGIFHCSALVCVPDSGSAGPPVHIVLCTHSALRMEGKREQWGEENQLKA